MTRWHAICATCGHDTPSAVEAGAYLLADQHHADTGHAVIKVVLVREKS